jgi:hypothetical protein
MAVGSCGNRHRSRREVNARSNSIAWQLSGVIGDKLKPQNTSCASLERHNPTGPSVARTSYDVKLRLSAKSKKELLWQQPHSALR